MKGNFTKREVKTLLLWLGLGALGLTAFAALYSQAFPEASIDFKITRTQALEVGKEFLKRHGFDVRGYRTAVQFSWGDDAKTYLEKELGLKVANRLMRRDVSVWHWYCRYFKAKQPEEFEVWISPPGRIFGFRRTVEEDRKGANLGQQKARAIAEAFLNREHHLDLHRYTLVEASRSAQSQRTDHTFVWERTGFKAKLAFRFRWWGRSLRFCCSRCPRRQSIETPFPTKRPSPSRWGAASGSRRSFWWRH